MGKTCRVEGCAETHRKHAETANDAVTLLTAPTHGFRGSSTALQRMYYSDSSERDVVKLLAPTSSPTMGASRQQKQHATVAEQILLQLT